MFDRLTNAAVDMDLSVTLFSCPAAPCPDGLQRFLFPLIPYGGANARRAPVRQREFFGAALKHIGARRRSGAEDLSY
jgi:hypothetical protein